MSVTYNIKGTSVGQFQIGKTGQKLVNSSNDLLLQTNSGTVVIDPQSPSSATSLTVKSSSKRLELLNSASDLVFKSSEGTTYGTITSSSTGLSIDKLNAEELALNGVTVPDVSSGSTGQVLRINSGALEWSDSGGAVAVKSNGTTVSSAINTLNFTGAQFQVTQTSSGVVAVNLHDPATSLIEEVVVGTASNTITLTSIPDIYDNLLVVIEGNTSSTVSNIYMSVNSDTDSNYGYAVWNKFGASQDQGIYPAQIATMEGTSIYSGLKSQVQVEILNYKLTGSGKKARSVQQYADTTDTFTSFYEWNWTGTSAITSITLTSGTGNFVSGTKVRLYGLPPGAIGAVTDLAGLSDVVLTSPSSGEVLTFNGTDWVNEPLSPGLPSATASNQYLKSNSTTAGDVSWVSLTKSSVGLSNVDNTADVDKSISTATQSALDNKEDSIVAGSTNQYWRGDKTWQSLNKAAVGLSNVDNTSDLSKPISTATQTALDGKESTITAGTTSQYWRGDKSWQTLNKTAVGLSNVDNTSDANKPVSTATQTALDLKADITSLADVATSGDYADLTGKPSIPTQLTDLTDTNIVTPGSGQVLTYDGSSSKWINTDASTIGATQLDQLSDVVLTSPTSSEVLQYNGTDWVNSPIAYSEVTGTPSLATVATSGAYSDLTGTPSLATVATSGLFADLTSKPTTLSGYGITDAVNTSLLGANSGVATLDSSGKIPSSQLSPLAITSVQTASSQSAMLALTTQEGDVVVRTDQNKSYIKNSGTSGTMSDFTELLSPPATVTSVNGQTGTVVLTKSDVGLGNVDNTSDANKPVSTATQTALNLKADISSLATVATSGAYSDLTGKPTIPTNLDSLTDVTITSASTDQVLQYNGSGWVNATFTPGASALDDLTDVVITTVANGDVLTWDSTSSKWVNLPNTGGGGSSNLDGLTDVVITSPSNTQILQYNGTNWVNAARPIDVPSGGTTGQVLRKASNTNYDFEYHTLDKTDVGLSNVDNTADTDKPISTATQTALDAKEPTITAGTTAQYWRGDKSWQTLNKAAVGLSNVDNTSDLSKPVSTAQQAALDLKLNLSGGTMTGDITMGTRKITTTASSFATNELVPKTYVDSAVSNVVITNSMLDNMPAATFKARNSGSTGQPQDLSVATVKTLLNLSGTNTGDQTITLTGDVTGSGTGSFAATLANSGVSAGSYTTANITVDAKGRITAASNGSVAASSLSGTTLASNVVSSSLTSVGTLTSLNVTGSVSASSFIGDGSSLTGIAAQTISNGSSNVNIATAGGNITFNPSGVSNVMVVSSTGTTVNGTLTTSSNIVAGSGTGGSITGASLVSATSLQGTITTTSQPNITSLGTLSSLTASGNITNSGGFYIASSTAGIASAGTDQAGATALTTQLNIVSTVSASSGVRLPAGSVGMRITVINTDSTSVNVYPPSGSSINSLSPNVALSVASGGTIDFIAISSTQWYSK